MPTVTAEVTVPDYVRVFALLYQKEKVTKPDQLVQTTYHCYTNCIIKLSHRHTHKR